MSSSQQQAASLGNQLAALQAAQQSLQASLEGKQTAEAALAVQLAQVGVGGVRQPSGVAHCGWPASFPGLPPVCVHLCPDTLTCEGSVSGRDMVLW